MGIFKGPLTDKQFNQLRSSRFWRTLYFLRYWRWPEPMEFRITHYGNIVDESKR
jgi:hypothetical protein